MPYCPYITGAVTVKVNLRDGDGFQTLGYSPDGVSVEEMFYKNDIYSDRMGGTSGPPIDRQYLGKSARIPLQLVEYDLDVVKKLRMAQRSENWSAHVMGEIVDIGGLTTCGNRAFQILLTGASDVVAVAADANAIVMTLLNYPNCWFDGPVRFPIGSKNTVFEFDVVAHPWTTNTAVSGDGKTRLFMQNNHLVTNLQTYAGTSQTA
jgi:hypothetical protein